MNKTELIEEADKRGLIADGMRIRTQLIEKLHNNEISLEEVQEKLKLLKKTAKKHNLYILEQFHKKNSSITLEEIVKKEIENRYNNLNNDLINKNPSSKKSKI